MPKLIIGTDLNTKDFEQKIASLEKKYKNKQKIRHNYM